MRSFSLLLLASVALCLGACAYYPVGSNPPYYRVTVTSPTGEFIADWIARGRPMKTEHGFRFRAVERISAPPYAQHRVYPLGRMMEIGGPNIAVEHISAWHTTTVSRTRTTTTLAGEGK